MARYKTVCYEQNKLIPIAFSKQILPGTFEYTLDYLNKGDRFILFMVNRRE